VFPFHGQFAGHAAPVAKPRRISPLGRSNLIYACRRYPRRRFAPHASPTADFSCARRPPGNSRTPRDPQGWQPVVKVPRAVAPRLRAGIEASRPSSPGAPGRASLDNEEPGPRTQARPRNFNHGMLENALHGTARRAFSSSHPNSGYWTLEADSPCDFSRNRSSLNHRRNAAWVRVQPQLGRARRACARSMGRPCASCW
jgi:hypothetical protein